jgi:hypothetical protein
MYSYSNYNSQKKFCNSNSNTSPGPQGAPGPNGFRGFPGATGPIGSQGTYSYIIRISVDNNAISIAPQHYGIYYLPIKMSALLL